jgi:hypothetical protein
MFELALVRASTEAPTLRYSGAAKTLQCERPLVFQRKGRLNHGDVYAELPVRHKEMSKSDGETELHTSSIRNTEAI